MSIFNKKSADPRTAKLKQLATAKFRTFFALPAAIIFLCFLKFDVAFSIAVVVLLALAAFTSFRKWKKLEKELNEEAPISDNEKKLIGKEIKKTVILLLIIFAFAGAMATGNNSSNSTKDQYEEVFNKDPNDWTKEDKQYVDNLFRFIDKQNKK